MPEAWVVNFHLENDILKSPYLTCEVEEFIFFALHGLAFNISKSRFNHETNSSSHGEVTRG
jgi:hypothetical protein